MLPRLGHQRVYGFWNLDMADLLYYVVLCGNHIVVPRNITSPYPYTADGVFPGSTPWPIRDTSAHNPVHASYGFAHPRSMVARIAGLVWPPRPAWPSLRNSTQHGNRPLS